MPAVTQSQSTGPIGTMSVNRLEGSTTGHIPNIVQASSHLQESRRSPFCSSGSHGAEHYHGRQARCPHPISYRTCSTTRPYTNQNFRTSLTKPVHSHQPRSPIGAVNVNELEENTLQGHHGLPKVTGPIPDNVAISSHPQESTRLENNAEQKAQRMTGCSSSGTNPVSSRSLHNAQGVRTNPQGVRTNIERLSTTRSGARMKRVEKDW